MRGTNERGRGTIGPAALSDAVKVLGALTAAAVTSTLYLTSVYYERLGFSAAEVVQSYTIVNPIFVVRAFVIGVPVVGLLLILWICGKWMAAGLAIILAGMSLWSSIRIDVTGLFLHDNTTVFVAYLTTALAPPVLVARSIHRHDRVGRRLGQRRSAILITSIASGVSLLLNVNGAVNDLADSALLGRTGVEATGNMLGLLPPPRPVVVDYTAERTPNNLRHCVTLVGRNNDSYLIIDAGAGNQRVVRLSTEGVQLISPFPFRQQRPTEETVGRRCRSLQVQNYRVGVTTMGGGRQYLLVRCGEEWTSIKAYSYGGPTRGSWRVEDGFRGIVRIGPGEASENAVRTSSALKTSEFTGVNLYDAEGAHVASISADIPPPEGTVLTPTQQFSSVDEFVSDAAASC